MKIREATLSDFDELYKIGLNTPELRVSANEAFMDKDDFIARIGDSKHIFLVAEEKEKIIGFLCINSKEEMEVNLENKYACLVYLVVLPEFRGKGIAKQLYFNAEKSLKKRGITHIYGWANAEGDGQIIKFLKKKGFAEGHKYVWMDKKL